MFDQTEADDDTQEGNDDFSAVIDISGYEEPKFELLAPGTYDAVIEDIEAGYSSNGNPMLTWRLQVADPNSNRQRTLFFFTMLTEDGYGRTKRTIRRIQPDYDLTKFVPANIGEELSGMDCRAVVRIRPYQGEKRNNVTDILAPAEGGFAD